MGERLLRLHDRGPTFDVGAHTVPPATVDALAQWFGFSAEELALNRAGYLSARQRQNVTFQGIGIILMGGTLILLDTLLAARVAPSARTQPERLALYVLVLLIVFLGIVISRGAADILVPRVRYVTGPLGAAGSARSPRLRAESHLLMISYRRWQRWQTLAAPERQIYRTYYVGITLLSVEPWNGS